MSERTVFLTPEGREKLQQELEHLRTVRRAKVAESIREAKDEGDIMENAAYDEAKNEQAFVEGRILTIEQMLNNAQTIEPGRSSGAVSLGTTVTVAEPGLEPEVYTIVGSPEADPTIGLISNESPVGRALMGHRVGDKVRVITPGGACMWQIIAIG